MVHWRDAVTSDFSIALCCNGPLLPGLHATLASLTRNLGRRDAVSLHLFISGIDQASQDALAGTVAQAGGVGTLQFHEMDLSDFQDFEALHGDRTAYLRLKLPGLLPQAETLLYLDSDLVVHTDLCEIFAIPLGDSPLGAITGETVAWSLDHDIYRRLGLADDDPCFNSGVLYFNAALWRKEDLTGRALTFARENAALLRSHDQTILNALFFKTFIHLPGRYNLILAPESRPLELADGIYHFMGSPKPWDPLGNLLHGNWRIWKNVIGQTRFTWNDFLARHKKAYAARAWALRFSYLRVMKRKLTALLRGR
jgi:lipopolysaccharide biosynthesis glycosyltransferase